MANAGRAREKAALEDAIRRDRRAVLVVNTHSRRGEARFREAERLLTARGFTLDGVFPVRQAERLPEIIREAIGRGHRCIVVGGGDGTISSVVDHFANTGAVFGLLPLGTANSFARSLGVPLDLEGAVNVIAAGKIADVDLVRINNDYFANGASIGLPADVGKATTRRLKRWFGRLAYVIAGARVFFGFHPFRCRVVADGREAVFEAVEVRIVNGTHQGGVAVTALAHPDTGDVVVQAVKGSSRWVIAREWARIALHLPFPAAEHHEVAAREVLIETDPVHDIAVDGEVLTTTPASISVARNALLVFAPAAFDDRH
jgi:YegS/Rv2252/BmrU family lipid kinase